MTTPRTNGRYPAGWDRWSPGDRVTVPGKRGRLPGEIADCYPGGVTVWVDGVPGMGRAFLYADLRRLGEDAAEQPIEAEDAARLAAWFGASARFWTGLQASHDAEVAALVAAAGEPVRPDADRERSGRRDDEG